MKKIIYIFALLIASNLWGQTHGEKYGDKLLDSAANKLRITHPNGGEELFVGSDIIITWEGVPPTDTVRLEYSSDNGVSWNLITNSATGLKYIWENIPNVASNKCLVKVTTKLIISAPSIQWEKSYGGKTDDLAFSIKYTFDGGYVIAGWSDSYNGDITKFNGESDYWIIKIDNEGNLQWQTSLGGSGYDYANSVFQTIDSGYIVTGSSYSENGDVTGHHGLHDAQDCWVVKLDKSGKMQWEKSYGGSNGDGGTAVIQVSDKGYIIAGSTNSVDGDLEGMNYGGCWLFKIDSIGNILWQTNLDGGGITSFSKLFQTSNNGLIVAGNLSYSNGKVSGYHDQRDYWVVKLDSSRNVIWQKCYGGTYMELLRSIQPTFDSGFIVCGSSESNDGDVNGNHGIYINGGYVKSADCWGVKLDSNGNIQWQRSLGGTFDDHGEAIIQTNDGFIVAGNTFSNDSDVSGNHGSLDYWIFKLDNLGNIQWQKTLGGSDIDAGSSIVQTPDNGFIIAGSSKSKDGDISKNHGDYDYWVVKLSPEGRSEVQQDASDSVWAIVKADANAKDIDMKRCVVDNTKDSVITDFIINTGTYQSRIDTIYFIGANADQFSLVSQYFPFIVDINGQKSVEIAFTPKSVGYKNAQIIIVADGNTIVRNIIGEGIVPRLSVISQIIDFGKVPINSTKDTLALILENNGYLAVNVTSTDISGPDKEQFRLVDNGSFSLQPGENKQLNFRFNPVYIGMTNTGVAFNYDGAIEPARTQLFGQGTGGAVYIADDSAYAGEVRNIKLKLDGIKLDSIRKIASSFSAKLAFNSTLLAFNDNSLTKHIVNNTTYLTIKEPLVPGDNLYNFNVTAGLGNTTETMIDIVEINWLDASGNILDYETETQPGTFHLLGICPEGGNRLVNPNTTAGILSIAPNPAENSINISLSLTELGATELAIYNVLGEKVQTLINEDVRSFGERTATGDLTKLATGQYVIVLKTPTILQKRMLVVVK